jgi:hypothetical protein
LPLTQRNSLRNLSPGGWLELHDIAFPARSDDGTLPPDSDLAKWNDYVIKGGHIVNHSVECAKHYKQQMIDAGFVNVHEKLYKWPINPWPKDLRYKEIGQSRSALSKSRKISGTIELTARVCVAAGMWTEENFCGGLHGLSIALFTRALGWAPDETEVFLAGVRKDLRNRQIHAYWPM